MRRLLPLALLPLFASPAVADDEPPYALLLRNRTCGEITVALHSRMDCGDLSTGCHFTIPPERYREVKLRFRERVEWMTVKVQGSCAEQPPSVTVGKCALPMGKLFPWNDMQLEAGYATPLGSDMQTYTPADNVATGFSNPVEIDVMLAECDADQKPASCRVFCRNPNASDGGFGDEGSDSDGSGDFE
ncbi:MAG: hypothetical protein U1E53_25040 [Dongiaceae bacterium]